MKLYVLMENTACTADFQNEHGLSLYIETNHHKLLFDMGPDDKFLENAKLLGVDINAVDVAVVSHGHDDHGGGLQAFLSTNTSALVYVSQYVFGDYMAENGYIGLNKMLRNHPRLRFVTDELIIDDELALYSCNGLSRPYKMGTYGLQAVHDGVMQDDDFRHEQYLLIHDAGRRILISGCSHKGVLNIMKWLKPDILVGGFHFMKVDPQGSQQYVLDEATQVLGKYKTDYYTCHCTGTAQYDYMKKQMGQSLHYLSSGQVIEL